MEQSGDKVLQVKLATVFKKLDSVAALSKQSLFEIVAGPIDVTKAMKYKREKNKHARNKKLKNDDSTDIVLEELKMEDDDLIEHLDNKISEQWRNVTIQIKMAFIFLRTPF